MKAAGGTRKQEVWLRNPRCFCKALGKLISTRLQPGVSPARKLELLQRFFPAHKTAEAVENFSAAAVTRLTPGANESEIRGPKYERRPIEESLHRRSRVAFARGLWRSGARADANAIRPGRLAWARTMALAFSQKLFARAAAHFSEPTVEDSNRSLWKTPHLPLIS